MLDNDYGDDKLRVLQALFLKKCGWEIHWNENLTAASGNKELNMWMYHENHPELQPHKVYICLASLGPGTKASTLYNKLEAFGKRMGFHQAAVKSENTSSEWCILDMRTQTIVADINGVKEIETKGPIRYGKQFESNPYMIC